MKKLILGLAAAAATLTAVAAVPSVAAAQPGYGYRHDGYHRGYHRPYYRHHPVRVCSYRYHRRVCTFR